MDQGQVCGTPADTWNQEIRLLLSEHYFRFKKAVLAYEVETGMLSGRALSELRDTVDHLALASKPGVKPEDVLEHVRCAKEHLRRGTVEPIEFIVEEKLANLRTRFESWCWCWWRFKFLNPPGLAPDQIEATIDEVKALILEGREAKAAQIDPKCTDYLGSYDIFSKALEKVKALEMKLKPAKAITRAGWVSILIGLGLLLLGGFLSSLIRHLLG